MSDSPFISADKQLPEFTLKAVALAVFLTIIFTAANIYLGLQTGLILSSSIPAAIIAMGIFRLSQGSILENNIVQTGASVSSVIAAGIVFTLPALLMIGYWQSFPMWQVACITVLGGFFGVLFSVPIRKLLLNQPTLRFPEGVAIAEVLMLSQSKISMREIVYGSILGAIIEFAQNGLHVLASSAQLWVQRGGMLFGGGIGFSPALLGAGYIVGLEVALSMLAGAVIGWVLGVPLLTAFVHVPNADSTLHAVMSLWDAKLRYIAMGVLVFAGLWTFASLIRPMWASLRLMTHAAGDAAQTQATPRTEQSLSFRTCAFSAVVLSAFFVALCFYLLPFHSLGFSLHTIWVFVACACLYVLIASFVFSVICGYFSGLVGVSASPVSAINLASTLLIAAIIFGFLWWGGLHRDPTHVLAAAASTILIAGIIAIASTISNNNIQDLKTGQMIGATPWKQQIVLAICVVAGALVAPMIMRLLFDVYGIVGAPMPRAHMDPSRMMMAPQAALIAAVTKGFFQQHLPWLYVGIGVVIALLAQGAHVLLKQVGKPFSVLAFAMGLYLPLNVTTPLIFGGMIAGLVKRRLARDGLQGDTLKLAQQRPIMVASGLIAGASVLDILIAIPFAMAQSTQVLNVVSAGFTPFAILLSAITTLFVCIYLSFSS